VQEYRRGELKRRVLDCRTELHNAREALLEQLHPEARGAPPDPVLRQDASMSASAELPVYEAPAHPSLQGSNSEPGADLAAVQSQRAADGPATAETELAGQDDSSGDAVKAKGQVADEVTAGTSSEHGGCEAASTTEEASLPSQRLCHEPQNAPAAAQSPLSAHDRGSCSLAVQENQEPPVGGPLTVLARDNAQQPQQQDNWRAPDLAPPGQTVSLPARDPNEPRPVPSASRTRPVRPLSQSVVDALTASVVTTGGIQNDQPQSVSEYALSAYEVRSLFAGIVLKPLITRCRALRYLTAAYQGKSDRKRVQRRWTLRQHCLARSGHSCRADVVTRSYRCRARDSLRRTA
jgi:hypothetical protein